MSLATQDRIRLKLRETALRLRKEEVRFRTIAGVEAISNIIRYLPGGREQFIELVQHAVINDKIEARAWYDVYRDLDFYERRDCSFDDICEASGISPDRLMSCIVGNAMKSRIDLGKLMAAMMHPDIVKQSAESAKRIVGDYAQIALEDRRMQFIHAGFIPAPKGTIVKVSANAQAAAAASAEPTVPRFAEDVQVSKPNRLGFLEQGRDTSPSPVEAQILPDEE